MSVTVISKQLGGSSSFLAWRLLSIEHWYFQNNGTFRSKFVPSSNVCPKCWYGATIVKWTVCGPILDQNYTAVLYIVVRLSARRWILVVNNAVSYAPDWPPRSVHLTTWWHPCVPDGHAWCCYNVHYSKMPLVARIHVHRVSRKKNSPTFSAVSRVCVVWF